MAAFSTRTKILLWLKRRFSRQERRKRMWVRKIFRERKQKGEFHLLIKELRLYDHEYFFKYFRMYPSKYEELFNLVAPYTSQSPL